MTICTRQLGLGPQLLVQMSACFALQRETRALLESLQ